MHKIFSARRSSLLINTIFMGIYFIGLVYIFKSNSAGQVDFTSLLKSVIFFFVSPAITQYLLLQNFTHSIQFTHLQARYPNQPWKWKPDWIKGFSKANNKGIPKQLFVIVGGLVTLNLSTLFFSFNDLTSAKGIFIALVILLSFVIMSVGFYQFRMLRCEGRAKLLIEEEYGKLGGFFKGDIYTNRHLDETELATVIIKCIKKMKTIINKEVRYSISHKWTDELSIKPISNDDESIIPLNINLPPDAPETEIIDEDSEYIWNISAVHPTGSFNLDFDIPVFKDRGFIDPFPDDKSKEISFSGDIDNIANHYYLEKAYNPNGQLVYIVRDPDLNKTVSRGILIFLFILGFCIYNIHLDVSANLFTLSTVIAAIGGVISSFLLFYCLKLLNNEVKILFGEKGIRWQRNSLLGAEINNIEYVDIKDVQMKVALKTGDDIYYNLVLNNNKEDKYQKKTLSIFIPSKREAAIILIKINSTIPH